MVETLRTPVIRKINDPSYIEDLRAHIREAFTRERCRPAASDQQDALSELVSLLITPSRLEEDWSDTNSIALLKLARLAVKRVIADQKLKEMTFDPSIDVRDGRSDPFEKNNLSLRSLVIDTDVRMIGTPPYRVQFESEEPDYQAYRRDHRTLPRFEIIPADDIGWTRRANGTRRRWFTEANCRLEHAALLGNQRSRYSVALCQAIPSYLQWLGRDSLHDTDRQIVEFVKARRVKKEDIPKILDIPKSSFYESWKRLNRRGFQENRSFDGTVSLNYFPVFDHNLSPIEPRGQVARIEKPSRSTGVRIP